VLAASAVCAELTEIMIFRVHAQAGKQAGKQAGRQAGRQQAGRQAGRQAGYSDSEATNVSLLAPSGRK
jgi:predicted transposase YdaD